MGRMMCPDCKVEVPSASWACPRCGKPGEEEGGKQLSATGMLLLLLLFVAFPVILFLIHIFVPGM